MCSRLRYILSKYNKYKLPKYNTNRLPKYKYVKSIIYSSILLNMNNNNYYWPLSYFYDEKYNFYEWHNNNDNIKTRIRDKIHPDFFNEGDGNIFLKVVDDNLKSLYGNFTYKLGLNTDHISFNPSGCCDPGGLYFTTIDEIFDYLNYGNKILIVEPISKIYVENRKLKCHKLYVHEILTLERFVNIIPDDIFINKCNIDEISHSKIEKLLEIETLSDKKRNYLEKHY